MFRRNLLCLAPALLFQSNSQCEKGCEKEQKRIKELEQKIEQLKDEQEQEWPELKTTQVDKEFVEDALSNLDGWELRDSYWWDDNTYNLPHRDGFGRVVLRDKINQRKYINEVFDCDNYSDHIVSLFSTRYTCNAVGTVISQDGDPHAFNVVVFPDGKAELWEPQSDEFVTDDNRARYSLRGALIRI